MEDYEKNEYSFESNDEKIESLKCVRCFRERDQRFPKSCVECRNKAARICVRKGCQYPYFENEIEKYFANAETKICNKCVRRAENLKELRRRRMEMTARLNNERKFNSKPKRPSTKKQPTLEETFDTLEKRKSGLKDKKNKDTSIKKKKGSSVISKDKSYEEEKIKNERKNNNKKNTKGHAHDVNDRCADDKEYVDDNDIEVQEEGRRNTMEGEGQKREKEDDNNDEYDDDDDDDVDDDVDDDNDNNDDNDYDENEQEDEDNSCLVKKIQKSTVQKVAPVRKASKRKITSNESKKTKSSTCSPKRPKKMQPSTTDTEEICLKFLEHLVEKRKYIEPERRPSINMSVTF